MLSNYLQKIAMEDSTATGIAGGILGPFGAAPTAALLAPSGNRAASALTAGALSGAGAYGGGVVGGLGGGLIGGGLGLAYDALRTPDFDEWLGGKNYTGAATGAALGSLAGSVLGAGTGGYYGGRTGYDIAQEMHNKRASAQSRRPFLEKLASEGTFSRRF